MGKFVAVEGCEIGHSSGSLVSGGTFVITNVASTKVKVNGNGVYKISISFTFSGGTHSSGTSGSAIGSGTITATSQKTKIEGQSIVLLGDSGNLTGTYIPPSTPPPTVAFTSGVEIIDSGQDKVKIV